MRLPIKSSVYFLCVCCVLTLVPTLSTALTKWRVLAPGLHYTSLDVQFGARSGTVHAFKVDLSQYRLDLAFAEDQQQRYGTVSSLTIRKDAVLGINGGFFTPQMQPLGLRIAQGKLRHAFKPISWWGVLTIRNGHPQLWSAKSYRYSPRLDFAIQSGPRLLVDGEIMPLKDGLDRRSALGITNNGRLVVVATQSIRLSTTELAEILRAPASKDGLACVDALNLDGGSSTQLYANIDDFSLSIPSFAPITDAVVVVPLSSF